MHPGDTTLHNDMLVIKIHFRSLAVVVLLFRLGKAGDKGIYSRPLGLKGFIAFSGEARVAIFAISLDFVTNRSNFVKVGSGTPRPWEEVPRGCDRHAGSMGFV